MESAFVAAQDLDKVWNVFCCLSRKSFMQKQNFGEKSFVIDQRLKDYPVSLNFYHQPPSGTVTLNDFESSALDRLSVLIAIESARLRAKKDEDVYSLVERVIQEHLELKPNSYNLHPERLVAQRRKDHLSHYVLRLAYCKTQALQNWFLKLESYLFKIRYMNASQDERSIFMEEAKTFAGLDYVSITSDEMKKEVGHGDMSIISQQMRILYDDCSLFYKTRWKNVSDLVAKRMVIVHKGYGYVPSSQHIVLVVKAFQDHLSHELKEIAKGLPRLDEDDRIMPILHSMAKQSLSKDYEITKTGDAITANDVAKLKQHFPPCMSQLQSNLVQQGHLKHTARLQYGLFLKGIEN